jgi:hypothetical protein
MVLAASVDLSSFDLNCKLYGHVEAIGLAVINAMVGSSKLAAASALQEGEGRRPSFERARRK